MEPQQERLSTVQSLRVVALMGGLGYTLYSLVRSVRRAARSDRDAFMHKASLDGYFDGLPRIGPIREASVDRVMRKHARKVRQCGITKRALKQGMAVEREHRDVTKGSIDKTARIAMAHLCERPDYYKRLKKFVEKS